MILTHLVKYKFFAGAGDGTVVANVTTFRPVIRGRRR
jgi:hypothetical protein